MTKSLHELNEDELGKLFPIFIAEYDEKWPGLFKEEQERIIEILGAKAASRIEHFGSTSVPSLASKPTIDILVEIPPGESISQYIIRSMTDAGYEYILRKDSPPPYMMFVKGYSMHGYRGQCYHIHMAPADHKGLWDRIYFRDYLIDHPETADKYERLKRELALKHKFHREKYTDAKKEFVDHVTTVAKNEYS